MPAVKTVAAIGNQQIRERKSTIAINLTAYLAGNGEKSWSQTWTHRGMPRAAMYDGNGTGANEWTMQMSNVEVVNANSVCR
jgi:hypothetical protein